MSLHYRYCNQYLLIFSLILVVAISVVSGIVLADIRLCRTADDSTATLDTLSGLRDTADVVAVIVRATGTNQV